MQWGVGTTYLSAPRGERKNRKRYGSSGKLIRKGGVFTLIHTPSFIVSAQCYTWEEKKKKNPKPRIKEGGNKVQCPKYAEGGKESSRHG